MKTSLFLLLSLLIAVGCEKSSTIETSSLSIYPSGEVWLPTSGSRFETDPVKIQVNSDGWGGWSAHTNEPWCRVRNNYRYGFFEIFARYNIGPDARTGKVIVTSARTLPIVLLVCQDAAAEFVLTPSEPQDVSWQGGVVEVSVSSDVAWEASSNRSWAVVDTPSGDGTGFARITVASNSIGESDAATISFSAAGIYKSLIINREANPNGIFLSTTPSGTKKFPVTGGEFTVTVNSNTAWTATSNSPWVQLETTSGRGNGTTHITVAQNTDNSPAAAVVTFKAETLCKELRIERGYTPPEVKYKYVCEEYSTKVLYNISGDYIREGYSTKVLYNISGNYIREGYSTKVLYNISGNYIREGYSSKVVYNLK